MLGLVELVTIFAVLNATLPQQSFPVDVDIRLPGEEGATVVSGGGEAATADTGAAQSTGLTLDTVTIGSVVALATGLFAAFRKNSTKVDAVADSAVNLKESLKATDYGNKDTAQILANALSKLQNVKTVEEIPQALSECAPAAKANAEEWKQDVREYYEVKPPITNADLDLDKTRQKLVEVNKETKKTPET